MSRTRTRCVAAAVGLVVAAGLAACGGSGDEASPPTSSNPTFSPSPTQSPKGYRLLHKYDLSSSDGWTLDDGQPDNAIGVDKPENVHFGAGPQHNWLLIEGRRDKAGGTFFTGEARAVFQPIPNYYFSRAVVSFDKPVSGMWPAVWKRPLDGGEGEIDDWEKFGSHLGDANEDHGALHTTPYDDRQRIVQSPNYPRLRAGRHVIETENAPTGFTWWVDGRKIGTITPKKYDQRSGPGDWDRMFGDADKTWYFRLTLQAGGNGGGPIPDDLMRWRFWVQELEVYEPE